MAWHWKMLNNRVSPNGLKLLGCWSLWNSLLTTDDWTCQVRPLTEFRPPCENDDFFHWRHGFCWKPNAKSTTMSCSVYGRSWLCCWYTDVSTDDDDCQQTGYNSIVTWYRLYCQPELADKSVPGRPALRCTWLALVLAALIRTIEYSLPNGCKRHR